MSGDTTSVFPNAVMRMIRARRGISPQLRGKSNIDIYIYIHVHYFQIEPKQPQKIQSNKIEPEQPKAEVIDECIIRKAQHAQDNSHQLPVLMPHVAAVTINEI